MSKKILYMVLVSALASSCSLFGYALARYERGLSDERVTEILDIYKAIVVKQFDQTNDWIGLSAVSQLEFDIELIKITESNQDDENERLRKLLWQKLSLTIEDLEKVCELKTHQPSKERCTKKLDEAYFYLKKYEHYKAQ